MGRFKNFSLFRTPPSLQLLTQSVRNDLIPYMFYQFCLPLQRKVSHAAGHILDIFFYKFVVSTSCIPFPIHARICRNETCQDIRIVLEIELIVDSKETT